MDDSHAEKENATLSPQPNGMQPSHKMIIGIIVVIGMVVLVFAFTSGYLSPTGLAIAPALPAQEGTITNTPNETLSGNGELGDPSNYLSRQSYFQEAFQPNREGYGIFEKASAHTGKPLSEMPKFFSIKNEAAIFSELPPTPENFGEIAYFLASGSFFAVGGLGEEYWKQPEFYPGFKENGLRYWTEPDASSWAPNGYGTYPAEQWATLKTGDTEIFEATVFLYSGYGVQTYQGVTLFPQAEASQHFDIEITPNTLILEPNFPAFQSEWAKKIIIRGTLKPDTPKGEYLVAVNVGFPPEDKRKEWALKYLNLYQDAAAGVRPSGNQITLHVNVE